MEYGCEVGNKFAFCASTEATDPQELVKKASVERAAKAAADKKAAEKAAREAEKKARDEAAAAAKASRGGARGGRGRGGPRGGGERGQFRGRGRGGPRTPFQPREGAEGEVVGDENVPEGEHPARRGGRGGFRGGRGRGGARGDRQSGSDRTGLKPQEKKEGHGRGNWGTDKDVLEGETEETKVSDVEDSEPIPPREKTEEELRLEAIEAEIAKQKTYAEFKAAQQKEDSFKIRQAGEGAEENYGVLRRVEKEVVVKNLPKKEIESEVDNTRKVLIDFKFNNPNRDNDRRGGYRGGRGGNTGGHRGRGASRGGSRQGHFNPNDTNAFPALG